MIRRAILIGATPESQDFLPGVERDLQSWLGFLCSPIGGAWYESDEVQILRTPTKEQTLAAVASIKTADYALIVFSGHGGVKSDELGIPETFLMLKQNELVSERELNPCCKRCLIFLDCCRTGLGSEVLAEQVNFSKTAMSTDLRKRYRAIYEKSVMASEEGCNKIYAADLNQEADDANSFSKILLRIAVLQAEKNPGIFSIDQAVDQTKAYFRQHNPQQTPRFNGGRRLHYFPFAMRLEE